MSIRTILSVVVLAACISGPASAAMSTEPRDIERRQPMPAGALLDGISAHGAGPMRSDVRDIDREFGFAAVKTREMRFYSLGSLLVNLEAAMRGNDRKTAEKVAASLARELRELHAPEGLRKKMETFRQGLERSAQDGQALGRPDQELVSALYSFVEQEKRTVYLRLGEWVESSRLALEGRKTGERPVSEYILKQENYAGYFLAAFKGEQLPPDVAEALGVLSSVAGGTTLGEAEVRKAAAALENIRQAME